MTAAAEPAVGIEALRDAARVLQGVAARTPLIEVPALSRRTGVPVFVKCEQLQPVGAFKIRGAYNAVSRVAREGGASGVITQSSGNHGQAIALRGASLWTQSRGRDAFQHTGGEGERCASSRR